MRSDWPVSVKGILAWGGQVVLLRNERDEWELPGGRLDPTDRSLPDALARELDEELGLVATVGDLIDTWIYEPLPLRRVVIVTYMCTAERPDQLSHSHEHSAVAMFPMAELDAISLPAGYRRSIELAIRSAP